MRLSLFIAAVALVFVTAPAIAQHDNDLHFGIIDGRLAVAEPPNFEAPKIMYFTGEIYVRDQGTDFFVPAGSGAYQLGSMTWRQISITPGLVGGSIFGGSYPGFLHLDSTGPHMHIPFTAATPGTYVMRSCLTDGVDALGNLVPDSESFTMIWVAGSDYAQVDLPLLYNLPDTPHGFPDEGFAGVDVDGLVVSSGGAFEGGFYAQSESRVGGVFVRTYDPVNTGDRVRVRGTLSTSGGERIVDAHIIDATPGAEPRPIAASLQNLGGGPMGKYTPGTKGGVGLSTTGLLVRVAGTIRRHSGQVFIDDGSDIHPEPGVRGVRIALDNLADACAVQLPSDGCHAIITGICGTEVYNEEVRRVIRPRRQADIREI